MLWLKQLFSKLRHLLKGSRFQDELSEEMAAHLEMMIEENLANGMSPKDAKAEAHRKFGNVESLKESCDESWGMMLFSNFIQDLKFGFRKLKKHKVTSLIAVISLGVGIGFTTAVFSIINEILLKDLPVVQPEQLREIFNVGPSAKNMMSVGTSRTLPDGRKIKNSFNYASFLLCREKAEDKAIVFAFAAPRINQVNFRGQALRDRVMMVSDNFSRGIGVRPIAGRDLTSEDNQIGAPPVTIVSHRFWTERFGKDTNPIGQTITINNTVFQVIGVYPKGFNGPQHTNETDIYVPFTCQPLIMSDLQIDNPRHWWIRIMVRLLPGTTDHQLKNLLDLALSQTMSPDDFLELRERVVERSDISGDDYGISSNPIILDATLEQSSDRLSAVIREGKAGVDNNSHNISTPFWIMFGAAALVFLAACSNLAGLLISRGVAEQPENSTRLALGASRWRIFRQSMTECLLLAFFSVILGWIVAGWAKTFFSGAFGSIVSGATVQLENDGTIFAFVILITVAATILFGVFPSIQRMKVPLTVGDMDAVFSHKRKWRAGPILVTSQVCLAFLLTAGSALIFKSVMNLYNTDSGHNPDNLLLFEIDAKNAQYPPDQRLRLYEQIEEEISSTPGVDSVSISDIALLARGASSSSQYSTSEQTEMRNTRVLALDVSPNFLKTLQIPLLSGRHFSETDVLDSEPVVIVTKRFAEAFFGEKKPIGEILQRGGNRKFRVVGMTTDIKYRNLKEDPPLVVYFPLAQSNPGPFTFSSAWFYTRSLGDPIHLFSGITQAVGRVNANLPVIDLTTQDQHISDSISRERFMAMLLFVFSLIGVFLCCLGIYGQMDYAVNSHTSEIGIRKALGAKPFQSALPVLKSFWIMSLTGVSLGVVAMLFLGGVLRAFLYEVQPYDPITLLGVVIFILVVCGLSVWVPANRASRISPMDALRSE